MPSKKDLQGLQIFLNQSQTLETSNSVFRYVGYHLYHFHFVSKKYRAKSEILMYIDLHHWILQNAVTVLRAKPACVDLSGRLA